jgi:hypothetical protein
MYIHVHIHALLVVYAIKARQALALASATPNTHAPTTALSYHLHFFHNRAFLRGWGAALASLVSLCSGLLLRLLLYSAHHHNHTTRYGAVVYTGFSVPNPAVGMVVLLLRLCGEVAGAFTLQRAASYGAGLRAGFSHTRTTAYIQAHGYLTNTPTTARLQAR